MLNINGSARGVKLFLAATSGSLFNASETSTLSKLVMMMVQLGDLQKINQRADLHALQQPEKPGFEHLRKKVK